MAVSYTIVKGSKDEKVSENRKLRSSKNQKVGGSKTCQPSCLLNFSPSCASPSYFLLFQNIPVYSYSSPVSLSLVASGADDPKDSGFLRKGGKSSFLFSISSFLSLPLSGHRPRGALPRREGQDFNVRSKFKTAARGKRFFHKASAHTGPSCWQ
jgi:hypothetical protein